MKNWLTLSLLLGLGGAASAQNANDIISHLNLDKKVIGPPPTVSAINRYEDVPVNLSTGAISISIPIFTINYKGLVMPISLNYSNNGIKVNEESSNVGLGWSLSAGGHISREVRGLPDESNNPLLIVDQSPLSAASRAFQWHDYDPSKLGLDYTSFFVGGFGYVHKGKHVKQFCQTNSPTLPNDTIDIGEFMFFGAYGFWDTEPDKFSFNIPSASGSFVLDEHGIPQLLEQSDLKIVAAIGQGINLKIVDTKGYTYYFEGVDNVEPINYSSRYTGTNGPNNPYGISSIGEPSTNCLTPYCNQLPISGSQYATTYYLTKIENENGLKVLDITYHAIKDVVASLSDASVTQADYNGSSSSYLSTINEYTTTRQAQTILVMDKISWPEGAVIFNYDATQPRQDVGNSPNYSGTNYPLRSIIVQNYLGEIIKEVTLTQGYFESTPGTTEPHKKRLKLIAVQEKNGAESIPPYQFTYNSIQLPSKSSFEQDYYGYYKPYTNTLLTTSFDPSFQRYLKLYVYPGDTANPLYGNTIFSIYPRSNYIGPQYILNGESREPDAVTGQAGMLTEIKYPTGGKDIFTYEPHTFKFDGAERQGGGFRIKQIERIFGNGSPNKLTRFQYTQTAGGTSGKLLCLPDFGKVYFDNYNPNEPYAGWTQTDAIKYTVRSFRPSNQLLTYNGSHVMYERIEVSETGNGKTVMEYSVPVHQETATYGNFNNQPIYQRTVAEKFEYPDAFAVEDPSTHVITTLPPMFNRQGKPNHNFPYGPHPNTEQLNGDLVKTSIYDQAGNLIQVTENQYEIKDVRKIFGLKINHFRFKELFFYDVLLDGQFQDSLTLRRFDQYFAKYTYLSVWKVLKSNTQTLYSQAGGSPTVKTYTYQYTSPNHKQLTSIRENTHEGMFYESVFRYPRDYTVNGNTTVPEVLGLYQLQQRNIVRPVEYITKIISGTNADIIDGGLYTYNTGANNQVFMEKYYKLEVNDPINTLSPTVYSTSFSKDDRFVLKDTYTYDNFNNLVQVTSTDNFTVSFIWGYPVPGSTGPLYPIAKVIGAPFNRAKFINFEWEPPAYSNSSTARTGNKARAGNLTLTASATNGPLSGTYRLGYWENLSNAWKYKTSIINYNPSSGHNITTSGSIDDISLTPVDAMLTSYTYTPLKGITSISTENATPSTFEYDLLGRLKRVKDLDQNITNLFEYNYKP